MTTLVLCFASSTLPKKVRRSVQAFRQSSLRLFLLFPPLHHSTSSAAIFLWHLHFINSINSHHRYHPSLHSSIHIPTRFAHFAGVAPLASPQRVTPTWPAVPSPTQHPLNNFDMADDSNVATNVSAAEVALPLQARTASHHTNCRQHSVDMNGTDTVIDAAKAEPAATCELLTVTFPPP